MFPHDAGNLALLPLIGLARRPCDRGGLHPHALIVLILRTPFGKIDVTLHSPAFVASRFPDKQKGWRTISGFALR